MSAVPLDGSCPHCLPSRLATASAMHCFRVLRVTLRNLSSLCRNEEIALPFVFILLRKKLLLRKKCFLCTLQEKTCVWGSNMGPQTCKVHVLPLSSTPSSSNVFSYLSNPHPERILFSIVGCHKRNLV